MTKLYRIVATGEPTKTRVKPGRVYYDPAYGMIMGVSGGPNKNLADQYPSITIPNKTAKLFMMGKERVKDWAVRCTPESPNKPVLTKNVAYVDAKATNSWSLLEIEEPNLILTIRVSIDRDSKTLVAHVDTKFDLSVETQKDETITLMITQKGDSSVILGTVSFTTTELANNNWVSKEIPANSLPPEMDIFSPMSVPGMWFDVTETAQKKSRIPVGNMELVQKMINVSETPDYPCLLTSVSNNKLRIEKILGGGTPYLINRKYIPFVFSETDDPAQMAYATTAPKENIDNFGYVEVNIPNDFNTENMNVSTVPLFHKMVFLK